MNIKEIKFATLFLGNLVSCIYLSEREQKLFERRL